MTLSMDSFLSPRRALWLLLFFALPTFAEPSSPPPIIEIDRIVAVVNDEVIVFSELRNRMRTMRAELLQRGAKLPPPSALEKQALDLLIMEHIQLRIAQRTGIRISDEQVSETIRDIAKKNGLGMRRFQEIIETDGYQFSTFREEMRRRLLLAELQKRLIVNRVQVTEREVDNYLKTHAGKFRPKRDYHLAHILIAVPKDAGEEETARARKKMDRVIGKLRGGADFARLAMAVSDGQKALEGGDLGWRKEDQLPGMFVDIVSDMEPGQISEPLRNASGFHIVKLIAVRGKERHVIAQTKVRHILVRTNEMTSNTDARTRLEQLRERIVQGEDFEELARAHSEDRGSAVKGGNIDWVGPGSVVPKFEQEMNRLAPMEISAPFRTQFGWHIAQVLGRRQHDGTEKVRRAKAMQELRKRKIDEELRTWLRQLRDEAYVEYRLEDE
uniref:Chaperone SurA n=1 Tax=Candidatus Kentrum sp. MB TaxID=2138164 RepID=A0A450XQI9_9GAMM|nr:MAG: periplasmic chaperone for outer membrane proteins SurA [Candidatus Kentron sp. MB]